MMSLTFSLIGLTVLTTVLAWTIAPGLYHSGLFRPYEVWHRRAWHQIPVHAFLHADVSHLLFNMITLFFFGPVLEATLGPMVFVVLYLSAIPVSSLPTLFRHRDNPNYASLGASGAVEAVLFAFIVRYPTERIYLFLIPIGIPAVIFGVLFLAYSLYESKKAGGTINHDAHLAGAIYGAVFSLLLLL